MGYDKLGTPVKYRSGSLKKPRALLEQQQGYTIAKWKREEGKTRVRAWDEYLGAQKAIDKATSHVQRIFLSSMKSYNISIDGNKSLYNHGANYALS